MSEHDEYEAQRVRGFADRIQAAGVRHAAMRRAAAPTGTPEAVAVAVEAATGWPLMTPEERAEIEALLLPDLRDGRRGVLTLGSEYERGVLSSVALDLLRRARAAEATIAGREAEPTHEEFLAHELAGGGWMVAYVTPLTKPGCQHMTVMSNYGIVRGWLSTISCRYGQVLRWWALATNGVPCAWPVPKGDEIERLKQREASR